MTAAPVRHHVVRVPATSANLGPGFDAFGLALDRELLVASRPREAQAQRVVTESDGAGELAGGDDNLVWRSLVAFCEHHDVAVPDVALRAVNHVPLERGLGSSSAAIVAGLTLGAALTGTVVGDLDQVRLATTIEGHPDNVAPAVLGGLVACATDDDGQLVVRRLNPAPTLRPVALVPATRQATSAARAVLPETLARADVAEQAARAGHVIGALAGVWPVAAGVAGDRLHEPARFAAMPASGALVAELRRGGVHAWLSGAGPTVVAALDGDGHDLVETAAARHGCEVWPTAVDRTGALACPDGGCALAGGGTCVRCPHDAV